MRGSSLAAASSSGTAAAAWDDCSSAWPSARWAGAEDGSTRRASRKLWMAGFGKALEWSEMGYLLTLRALAEAGLGAPDEAVCHWQAAQHLDPRLYHSDLAAYGSAGELLEANRWGTSLADGDPVAGGTPPSLVKTPRPLLPFSGVTARTVFVMAGIVDSNGHVRQPVLWSVHLEAELEPDLVLLQPAFRHQVVPAVRLMAISALESVCSWRFEPARVGNEPRMAASLWTVRVERLRSVNISGGLRPGSTQGMLDPRPPRSNIPNTPP